MEVIKKIWKTGTGYVVTIDKKFMRFFKLKAGDEVIIEIKVKPKKKRDTTK